MAKPLGEKSRLIREAITAHPDTGNTELAGMINASPARKEDKVKVTANDVAQQKQAMKKAGAMKAPAAAAATAATKPAGNGRKKPGRKAGRPAAAGRSAPAVAANPVDLIDRAFALAQECGGVNQLKRLVDRLAEMRGA